MPLSTPKPKPTGLLPQQPKPSISQLVPDSTLVSTMTGEIQLWLFSPSVLILKCKPRRGHKCNSSLLAVVGALCLACFMHLNWFCRSVLNCFLPKDCNWAQNDQQADAPLNLFIQRLICFVCLKCRSQAAGGNISDEPASNKGNKLLEEGVGSAASGRGIPRAAIFFANPVPSPPVAVANQRGTKCLQCYLTGPKCVLRTGKN